MKSKRIKKLMATLLSAAMMLTSMTTGVAAAEITEEKVTAEGEKPVLWLVGDSTVCQFTDNYYYPRYGYGTQIENYLDGTYEVKNLALSGRSSLSFLSEENYKTLTSEIKSDDILMVGFGHNDEKYGEDERFTSAYPTDTWETEGSFAKSLYDNYVKMANDKGASVILCTPICRRNGSGTLSASEQHKPTINGQECDYADAIKKLAEAKNVPCVDLTTLTKDLYEEIGAGSVDFKLDETNPDNIKVNYSNEVFGTLFMHAWTGYKPASVDNTHLNIYGAKKVAYMFAEAVKNTDSPLAAHVSIEGKEPTREKDLVPKADFKIVKYEAPTTDSTKFTNTFTLKTDGKDLVFKPTIFGALGSTSAANFTFESTTDSAHIVAKNDKGGKITDKTDSKEPNDGFVMYYLQIPSNALFKFSAKATLNSIGNNQSAFGLIARDDMYIDTQDSAIVSDYVVAGSLGTGAFCNCFGRREGKLIGRAPLKNEIEAGKTYDLSITKNPDGYSCAIGGEEAQSGGYDFQLTGVDADYQYIGMFVTRTADVTFTDIKFEMECEHEVSGNYIEKKDATCKDEGKEVFNCAKCGKEVTNIIPKTTNHTWDDGEVTKDPTEAEEGVKTYTCTVCKTTKTEPIAKLEPAGPSSGDGGDNNPPEEGCKEHTWNAGEVTKEPTETEEGVKTYTCTACGETKTESIAKLVKKEEVTPADATEITPEEVKKTNDDRIAAGTTGSKEVKKVDVQQADGDTVVVKQGITGKGKTKTLEIFALGENGTNASKERVDFYITLNAGTKYAVKGSYEVVSAINGSETTDAKALKKIALCSKPKNGMTNLTIKAVKRTGAYKVTICDKNENVYLHIDVENIALKKTYEVTPLSATEVGFYQVGSDNKAGTKASAIKSAEWFFGKTPIYTDKDTDLMKGSKKLGTAHVDSKTGNVIVKVADGVKKGSIKLKATVNKKSYATTLKIK